MALFKNQMGLSVFLGLGLVLACTPDNVTSDAGADPALLDAGLSPEQIGHVDAEKLCIMLSYASINAYWVSQILEASSCAGVDSDMNSEWLPEEQPLAEERDYCVPGDEVFDRISAALAAGRFVVRQEYETCAAAGLAYRQNHTTINAVYNDPPNLPLSCTDLIIGLVAEGSPCSIDWECAPGLVCDLDMEQNALRCLAPVAPGGACLPHPGLFQNDQFLRRCVDTAECVDNTCEQLAGLAQSCEQHSCIDGLICDANNICVAPPLEGEACAGDSCAVGLYCRASDHLCHAREELGTVCSTDDNCQACLFCVATSADGTSVCRGPSEEGGYCERDGHCSDDLVCSSANICVPPFAQGESCSRDAECQEGLVCSSANICVAPFAQGESCSRNAECQEGLCYSGTCSAPAAEGEPCYAGHPCAGDLACTAGVCSADVCASEGNCPLGSACDFSSDCNDGLFCDVGKHCATRLATGEACQYDSCQEGSACLPDGFCGAPALDGEPCQNDAQCASKLCFVEEEKCIPQVGGCIFDKNKFGTFVFLGLVLAPMRRRRLRHERRFSLSKEP